MRRFWAAIHISIGLTLLTVGLLMGADVMGLIPDRQEAVLDGRRRLCESIGVACSIQLEQRQPQAIATILSEAQDRNPEIRSMGLRLSEGRLVAKAGEHERLWRREDEACEAMANGDMESLYRSAHALKGSVGSMRAQSAFEAALNLEQIGRRAEAEAAPEALKLLLEQLERLESALAMLAPDVCQPAT